MKTKTAAQIADGIEELAQQLLVIANNLRGK